MFCEILPAQTTTDGDLYHLHVHRNFKVGKDEEDDSCKEMVVRETQINQHSDIQH